MTEAQSQAIMDCWFGTAKPIVNQKRTWGEDRAEGPRDPEITARGSRRSGCFDCVAENQDCFAIGWDETRRWIVKLQMADAARVVAQGGSLIALHGCMSWSSRHVYVDREERWYIKMKYTSFYISQLLLMNKDQ
ncbi:hypothetical protein ASPWEDRAFT_567999 [Aspergillus wentii DTO 134E9]|uniref:Uncharacterized protein n=1 Tax=Aspergillus wentii DTO 134E9 TaxID=1073089 RepID=A0A1L9RH26_ASPWE|nr:uncharacterized protein ASPWEDRAFT_567999 [Aspergillus wentii DTO 134E9]OJJ34239.1 hypothetical protein ASPWEDRAFT_567999 [Aspergillus wentii DTO 134E9]